MGPAGARRPRHLAVPGFLVAQGLGAQKLDTVRRGNGRTGEIALLKLPGNMDLSAAVQALSADPARSLAVMIFLPFPPRHSAGR